MHFSLNIPRMTYPQCQCINNILWNLSLIFITWIEQLTFYKQTTTTFSPVSRNIEILMRYINAMSCCEQFVKCTTFLKRDYIWLIQKYFLSICIYSLSWTPYNQRFNILWNYHMFNTYYILIFVFVFVRFCTFVYGLLVISKLMKMVC